MALVLKLLHYRKPFFGLLIILFFSPIILPAQSIFEQIGRLPVTTYSAEEYGGHPAVWAAIQSEEGLMYFGTDYGLHEYDGVSWRSFFDRNTTFSILGLSKDDKGRIFYAGQDFGYLMSNPKGEMQAVSLLHLIPEEVRTNFLANEIHFLNGEILLRIRDLSLIRLELAQDFTLKSLKSWQAETRFGWSFLIGDEIFVKQFDRGIFRLEGEEFKLVTGTDVFGKEALSVMLPYLGGDENQFLLGSPVSGFYLFDGTSVSKFPREVDKLMKEGRGQLYHALPYQGNYILSFAGAGIVIMSPKGEILNRIGTGQGLPSDYVTEVYLDQGQGLWAMTEDGIARIAIDSPIQTFGKELGINSEIRSIQKQGESFFLGTSTGLVKFDEKSKTFQAVPEYNNYTIVDLKIDGEDLIVPSSQLQVYRDGKAIRLDFPNDGSRPTYNIIPKNNPNLLLVGTTADLLLYERGLSKEFPWELKGRVPDVGRTSYFFEMKDGTIFTYGAGKTYLLNLEGVGLESSELTGIKSTVFEGNASEDMFSLVDGEFYKTSPEGMKKYSTKEGKLISTDDFSEVEKDMFDFAQLNTGILWYESLAGKKFVLKRNEAGKFVKDDTPNSVAPYLSQTDFMDEDSIMWFGSQKGLVRYDPKKDRHTNKEFFTLIRRIETKTDTLPLIAYGRDKSLPAVEMKANSYRFEFAAPYFEEEKKTKYQTYLEGFDADWVDWNDNKFKEYTNLPAGSYTFRVRAQAFTGRVSEEAVFSFVVLPPWYATWWAYLLYALLIFVVISAIVKWRSQKLKAENRVLEEKVKERTAELEQSYHNVELLGEIGRKITASLSAEKIIATVYTNVNALMEASVLGIGIYQEETQTLDFPSTYENGAPLAPYSNSLQDPNRLAALCFNTGNEIVINDLNAEYGRYLQQMPTPSGGEVPVSLIYLPLKVKGNKFGVITVQSFTKNAFSEYHLYMLRTIAVYTAIALENSESFQNLQQTLSSLKATQSQLIQSEKMASLGELTAGIAHEIQNPLNFVNNFSELNTELIDELVEEAEKGNIEEVKAIAGDLKENESKINHHGKRADAIVKGMLAHSRTSSGEKEPTDVNALADEYLRLSYHGLRARDKSFNADFKTDFDPNLPEVNVVPQDIGRVLLNIVNNAFQAVGTGRSLNPTVTVSTSPLEGGRGVKISISDNGPGIPPEIKDKIFQPFFTTKPTGQGTGLGLSLSYDIVKAHGGEIRVESKVGERTEFTIQLPSL